MIKDPSIIYLIGFMGSGKTSFGKKLSRKLNYGFSDLDALIEEAEGQSIAEIFEEGEEKFRLLESKYLLALTSPKTVYSLGGGTPCYGENMEIILERGIVIYLDVREGVLYSRLNKETDRPMLVNKSGDELKSHIHNLLSERLLTYEKADIKFDPIDQDLSNLLEEIRQFK